MAQRDVGKHHLHHGHRENNVPKFSNAFAFKSSPKVSSQFAKIYKTPSDFKVGVMVQLVALVCVLFLNFLSVTTF